MTGASERARVTDALSDGEVRLDRTAFLGATLSLGLIGGIAAAYGTFLIGIAHHFGLAIATAGLTLSANFAGALLGVVLCWRALGRFSGEHVLAASLGGLAVGLTLAALAPDWPAFVVGIALSGIGFGAVDFGVVALVSRTASDGRAARLSVSGSGWAFGAIAGPLLIVLIRPAHFEIFLGVAALVALALTVSVRTVRAPAVHPELRRRLVDRRAANRRAVLVTFLAGFASYVALETASAGWLATQLHGWGFAAWVGSLVTAGFWAGLAVGRLLAGRLSSAWVGHGLVLVGLGSSIALLFAAGVRPLAPLAYPLIGFALASVFPLGLHWFTQLSPDDHNGIAWLVLIDMVGGILGSGAESVAVGAFGLRAIPYVAAGFAVLCLAVFASALRFPALDLGPRSSPA